jgi:hypothetical protein
MRKHNVITIPIVRNGRVVQRVRRCTVCGKPEWLADRMQCK